MNDVPPPLLPEATPPKKKKSGCLIALLIGVAGVFGLMVLFFVLGSLAARDADKMAEAAEPFFLATEKGDFAGAYGLTAKAFQDDLSLEAFSQFAKDNGLADYAAGEWEYAAAGDDGDGAIEGHVMTSEGEKFPLRIAFVTTGDRRMISSISQVVEEEPVEIETAGSTTETASGSSGEKKVLFSFTTAKLKNIRFNTNPDEDSGIGEEFADNVDGIYLRGDLVGAMDGTEITARWYNLDLDKNEPMVSKTLHTGSQVVTFSLTRTADMLPAGPYRLDIAIEGKVKNSLNFRIREASYDELKAAADAGGVGDAFRIFLLHLNNEQSGVSQEEAARYVQQAAEGGHSSAQYNLGVLHDRGIYLPKDEKAAVVWYRKAAAQGDSSAHLNLAQIYRNGGASDIEVGEAIAWAAVGAEKGDPRAIYALGIYSLTGTGTEKDLPMAVEMFEKAAEMEATMALFVGDMYETGKSLPQDLEKAVHWYRSAAERGEPNAAAALQRLGGGEAPVPAGQ